MVCSRALRGFEPHSPKAVLRQEITRAAPARDVSCSRTGRPTRIRTWAGEVGARHAAVTPRACRPCSVRPAGIEPATSATSEQHSPLSYGRQKSLRQDSNPHLGRTKGACLPLTLRRLDGDGGNRTHACLGANKAACHRHPHVLQSLYGSKTSSPAIATPSGVNVWSTRTDPAWWPRTSGKRL
jgi:hypothetical protein